MILSSCSYTPRFKVGDCIYEKISTAVVVIDGIKNRNYQVTSCQWGICGEEELVIRVYDRDKNLMFCGG